MDGFEKLKSMLDSSMNQAAEESGMLLGQTLTAVEVDSLSTNKQTYFSGLDDAYFILGIESREDYKGQFYVIFSLRDAIIMSGLLLGIPPQRINEKKRLCILEPDDQDAFGEVANIIIGAFNSTFDSNLEKKAHLKLLPPKKFISGTDQVTDGEPLPEGEYLLFRFRLEIPGQEMEKADILIPADLAALYDPPTEKPVGEEEEAEGEVAAGEEGAAESEEGTVVGKKVIVLESDAPDRQMLMDSLAPLGAEVVDSGLEGDVQALLVGNEVKVVLLGLPETSDQQLAICVKIKAMAGSNDIPIIICAKEWTRTSVLKALKYGVKEIIVKPPTAEEVKQKVSRILKAA